MKIVKLKGGLGNQMFQYAYAQLLHGLTKEDVKLDLSSYTGLKNDAVRVPRLLKFRVSLPVADEKEIRAAHLFRHSGNSLSFQYKVMIMLESILNRKYFREKNRAYIEPETIAGHTCFDGYWQSWRYVERVADVLREEFVPNYDLSESTRAQMAVCKGQNAVFVGVRKGDYTSNPEHYGKFSNAYYLAAMQEIERSVPNPVYYIFSNDVAWCQEHMDWGGREVHYRLPEQQTSDFEELLIMASCRHAIIVNSSYHWWGAYLMENPEKIVCCPQKWFFDDKPIDIIPPSWRRIADPEG